MPNEDEKSLKNDLSRKFLEKCIKELEVLDEDLTKALDQLEAEAKDRLTDSYYEKLSEDCS